MKTKIYIPDIECDSCSRLLKKRFDKLEGISSVKFDNEGAEVEYDESRVDIKHMVKLVQDNGFRASIKPFERKTFTERIRDFKENKHKYKKMVQAIQYSFFAFLILVAVQALMYFGLFRNIPDFITKFGWWMFYLDVSVVSLAAGLYYFYSYRTNVTCMTGMMIGMIMGMQAGMMIGAVIGAVNGFFIGAMAGMLIGVIVGGIAGNCCGIMGILQGLMAGMMGGTMGAMITFMMFTDNVLWFMPFFTFINVAILAGFIYMYFEEAIEQKKEVEHVQIDFLSFASVCIIASTLLVILMVYAPKSALFGG